MGESTVADGTRSGVFLGGIASGVVVVEGGLVDLSVVGNTKEDLLAEVL